MLPGSLAHRYSSAPSGNTLMPCKGTLMFCETQLPWSLAHRYPLSAFCQHAHAPVLRALCSDLTLCEAGLPEYLALRCNALLYTCPYLRAVYGAVCGSVYGAVYGSLLMGNVCGLQRSGRLCCQGVWLTGVAYNSCQHTPGHPELERLEQSAPRGYVAGGLLYCNILDSCS